MEHPFRRRPTHLWIFLMAENVNQIHWHGNVFAIFFMNKTTKNRQKNHRLAFIFISRQQNDETQRWIRTIWRREFITAHFGLSSVRWFDPLKGDRVTHYKHNTLSWTERFANVQNWHLLQCERGENGIWQRQTKWQSNGKKPQLNWLGLTTAQSRDRELRMRFVYRTLSASRNRIDFEKLLQTPGTRVMSLRHWVALHEFVSLFWP